MAKTKKPNNQNKQPEPAKVVKKVKTTQLSDSRLFMNDTLFNNIYKIKTELPSLKTKDLRNKLILVYNVTKSRANDIAGRVIRKYKLEHPE